MRVYYDRDADLNLIKGKKVAVVGYGSQGHAHVLNLRDSGVKDVTVALRKGSASVKKAETAGVSVLEVAEAAKWADVIMMLTPDELQADIYREPPRAEYEEWRRADVCARPQRAFQPDRAARRYRCPDGRAQGPWPHGCARNMRAAAACPACWRSTRIPQAMPTISASPYASAIGGGRAGIIENLVPRGMPRRSVRRAGRALRRPRGNWIRGGYETLVEAGYAPEMAYFECLHEVKLIVDLIYEGGHRQYELLDLEHRRIWRIRHRGRASSRRRRKPR